LKGSDRLRLLIGSCERWAGASVVVSVFEELQLGSEVCGGTGELMKSEERSGGSFSFRVGDVMPLQTISMKVRALNTRSLLQLFNVRHESQNENRLFKQKVSSSDLSDGQKIRSQLIARFETV